MNIIRIDGGLGNQMFQYALALKMESMGREVKLDITKYAEHHCHNDFELDRVFHLKCNPATEKEVRSLGYRKENHWTELLKRTPLRKKTIYTNEGTAFDSQVLSLDGFYIEGFWQCERYFADIREKILDTYRFPAFESGAQREYAEQIRSGGAVSVHIRRGDYLNYPKYQGICTLDYYKKAMAYFRGLLGERVRFYIFTDDIPWAEENFAMPDCRLVRGNIGADSFRDMQLMSLCEHHIVANSSFSWWGAWLSRNPGKQVIAPECWMNGAPEEEAAIIPESWMRMEG